MSVASATTNRERWLVPAALAVAGIVLLMSLLSDDIASGFRQAQTAISVYWMLHGGPWLDYWTPVLGYPWAIPFEFPLYQWIVAGVTSLGIGIGQAGILVSFVWLVASLWPATYLARSYGLSALTRSILCTLILLSPIYLDLGTELMIETQAMALSLGWLALLRRFLDTRSVLPALAAALIGVMAALTKVTTMPPYLLLGAAMTLVDAWRTRNQPARTAATLAVAVLIVIPLVAATVIWNHHADALKALNPNADMLRSDSAFMTRWNFGTPEQRVSFRLGKALVRMMLATLGVLAPVLIVAAGLLLWRYGMERSRIFMVAALMAAFLLPILILTNLYIEHGYYAAANIVFAIAAYAVVLGEIGERRPKLAMILVTITAASQLVWFVGYNRSSLIRPVSSNEGQAKAVGQALSTLTPPEGVIAIYGLDWSSVAPFYAQRKSLMEPDWAEPSARRYRLGKLFKPVGGQPMAAVVRCPSALDADPQVQRRFNEIAAKHVVRHVAGCAIYLPRGATVRPGSIAAP